jgi:aryl-alcohol dehydrogenase-like predicted oxidoreductase
MNETEFSHTHLPAIGKRVLRLGVASNYGLDTAGVHHAAERGVNFWFWSPRHKRMTPALKQLLARDRERHVVAAITALGLSARGVRSYVDKTRKLLGIDQLDLVLLSWLGRTSRFSPAIQEELVRLRDQGAVRAVGTSIHDRVRAGELARDSVLDALMIRYNAAHPGAEQDIFPHLEKRQPLVISYTTTCWRQLLKPLKGIEMEPWPGPSPAGASIPPLTPELCYRFVLGSPHLHVALTAPANRTQLDQNLDVLNAGPLSEAEDAWVRQYGRQVRARKKIPFI